MITTIIVLLFLAHPNIVEAMFSCYACKEILTGEHWLLEDLDIRCWEGDHVLYAFTVALPGMIAWGIGIPAIALILLIKNRKTLDTASTKMKYGFIYNGYAIRTYYWETIIVYRKICIVFVAVFLTSVSTTVQALTAVVVIMASFYFQEVKKPYDTAELNSLELRSITVSGITIYSGLYYLTDDIDHFVKILFFAIILGANLYFLFYWIFGLFAAGIDKIARTKPHLIHSLCKCCPSIIYAAEKALEKEYDLTEILQDSTYTPE